MALRTVSALLAAATLLAGCGNQSLATPTSGAATGRPKKLAPAQEYIVNRAHKRAKDDEGPQKLTPGRAPLWSYHVVLTGEKAGRGISSSTTRALVTLRANRVCWRFGTLSAPVAPTAAFGGIRAALAPAAADIHLGARGRTGPVVVVFGARFVARGCIVVRPVVVNSIAAAPRFYYLNLVAARHPHEVLRAQL
jgi:hypothetical protein